MSKLIEKARAGIARLTETRAARWLIRHRPLWNLLWGLAACAVAIAVAIWPTDQMRATATGLVLLWLVEQALVLRAIRRQRVHQLVIKDCENGIVVTGGPSEAEMREAVQRAIEELAEEPQRGS
jgi:hypothetical protein